ncbi:hypothetical protein SLA2020_275550 [Shorea laevis]
MGDAEDHVVPPETVDIPVYGVVHPDPTQLLAAVTQLVTAMTQEREARQPFAGQGCTFKNFYSHNFDGFDGTGDHISVENWLNDMENFWKLQDVMIARRCLHAYKLSGKPRGGGRLRRSCLF